MVLLKIRKEDINGSTETQKGRYYGSTETEGARPEVYLKKEDVFTIPRFKHEGKGGGWWWCRSMMGRG